MSKESANFEITHPSYQSEDFKCTKSDWMYINDGNANVYTSNLLIFNSTSLIGKDPSKLVQLGGDDLLVFPYTYKVTIAGGAFVVSPNNVNACCLKNHYSLVDRQYLGLGSSQDIINSGSYFQNMMINENVKRRAIDEQNLAGELSPSYLDNDNSYNVVKDGAGAIITEINNNLAGTNVFNSMTVNDAIMKRNSNRFVVHDSAGTMNFTSTVTANGFSVSNAEKSLDNGATTYTNTYTPYMTQSTTEITYYDIITLRLADLNDFFKKMNTPLSRVDNFNYKVSLNAGTATVTYKDSGSTSTTVTIGQYQVANVSYNANNGFTCPFLLGSASNVASAGDGIVMTQTATGAGNNANGIVLTVTGSIGWSGYNIPARLQLRQLTLTPSFANSLISNPHRNILYNDFHLDQTVTGVLGNGSVQKLLTAGISRGQKVYIIPFLSNQNKFVYNAVNVNMIPPYQSAVSSAPTTCSHLRLRDIQVRFGNSNAFEIEQYKYSWQNYDLAKYALLNSENGNAMSALYKSGLITKSMFHKCYNVYEVDLQMDQMEAEWDVKKQLNVQFTCDGNPAVLYDFLILIEYQRVMGINVATCETVDVKKG
jgi:hypothetical protein